MKPYGVLAVINAEDQMWDFWVTPDGNRPDRGRNIRARLNRAVAVPEDDFEPEQPEREDIHVFCDGVQTEVSSHEAAALDPDQTVFYVDTEEDAHMLAAALARKNPQNRYMTFRTSHVYHCPPGEVQRAEFNEKGLLPS